MLPMPFGILNILIYKLNFSLDVLQILSSMSCSNVGLVVLVFASL